MTGPISFAVLVPTIEKRLNAELQGYSLRVGGAILRLAGDWGLEFRLANVSVVDEHSQEIAKAPLAAIDVSERSLLSLSLAASQIDLIGPKVLVFNLPGQGLTLTRGAPLAQPGWAAAQTPADRSPEPPELASARQMARQAFTAEAPDFAFNPAPFLARLFAALEHRGGASSALERIGFKDAVVYFAGANGVSTWRVDDFHIDLDERSGASALAGQLTVQREDAIWRASFRAINHANEKRYSLTASVQDIVPRAIWANCKQWSP